MEDKVLDFTYKGVNFHYENTDFSKTTTADTIIVLKPEGFLHMYDQYFNQFPTSNVLEIGVFEGGSLIYQALRHPELQFVGIDIRKKSDIVLDHIKRLGLEDRIKIYYETSQDDEKAIRQIVLENFGDAGFDVVSDDASHLYQLSKSCFEIVFPLLNDGGFYILEDWAWAHWEGFQSGKWENQPALTNLLIEIMMLIPSQPGLMHSLDTFPAHAVMRKKTSGKERLNLDALIKKRGRELVLV